MRASTRSSAGRTAHGLQNALCRFQTGFIGDRVCAFDDLDTLAGHRVALRSVTTSPDSAPGQLSSTARAMAAEALPAPTAIRRPDGGGG